MIQLPSNWLEGQFDGFITRGGIIRFHAEDLNDPDHPDGKTKFAVILNTVLPATEIHYVFATSKTDFYNKRTQFEQAIIRVGGGTYACFPRDTVIPFRSVRTVETARLKAQYAAGRLTFVGTLSVEDVARMDAIVKHGFFINPRTRKLIQP